ncbi:sensor histidine kinase YesM [Algoriphagus sp. 4150]|uniref:sensor histidine kinase n=1 Tax=Algoriphagus sp. 4150 TaxID=2817756 RepID=UPI0028660035|nr:histidine kinase [Algoriphagus sp. 4150]MDR7131474.1 sensor histidine kinase YesM [Algoriphagus sp. 4150]
MIELDKNYNKWTLERISRHVIYWGFWLSFYGIVNGSFYEGNYTDWFFYEVLFMTVKIPYSYYLAYRLFPRYLPRSQYIKLALLVAFYAFVGMVILYFLDQLFPMEKSGKTQEFLSSRTLYMIIDLIYIASPVVAIKLIQQNIFQTRANERLKSEKVQAELQNLKNQLQPHFLFNTLNNIYSMVISGDQFASGSILKLSDILSYILYECNVEQALLSKEVSLIKNYIDLEKLRYGGRLDLYFDIQGSLDGVFMAPLLLMPFVENAFKHGPSIDINNSWIRIYLFVNEEELVFMVENKISQEDLPSSPVKSGIGLLNVKKRLALLYPDNHELVIIARDTFLVRLNIKF